MTVRLAVDIGGTFTDVVLDGAGALTAAKVPTTPAAPAEGFMAGTLEALRRAGLEAAAIDLVLHGTTLATNRLIERKGAVTALFVTEGHRDSLAIAWENRFDQYDIMADRTPPLAPRRLRWPVKERIDAAGEVLVPLDEGRVADWLDRIGEMGVESVAIGLLHAYANPAHERRLAAMVAERFPALDLSLSCEVCPEVREYERQSTTVANAYVKPAMARYLADVEARLHAAGCRAPILMMTSAGSLVTLATARAFPVRLIESGPAGGAMLAAHLARRLGEKRLLSFDMGGTTAKICLIDDGRPATGRSFEADRAHRFMKGSGMPLKIPVVEMVEIGAGGGSLARADALGRIRVGPASAGADPGPACYGRGGRGATVTDANLVLGRLDASGFAGGTLPLRWAAAEEALAEHVGAPLGLGAAAAAAGAVEIVDENMAAAARVHAAERGTETASRTMVAFGGAAPLHAARLAEKLAVDRLLVPAGAGVGSALGFLLAPAAYEVVRSRHARLQALDAPAIRRLFAAMSEEARRVVALAAPGRPVAESRHAWARYTGQGHEVKVDLPPGALAAGGGEAIRLAFEEAYRRQFARTVPGLEVEVLTWSVVAWAEVAGDGPPVPVEEAGSGAPAGAPARRMAFPGHGGQLETALWRRGALAADAVVAGPAAIEEAQTTTVVPPGWQAETDGDGNLLLTRLARRSGASMAGGVARQVLWDRLIAIVEEQATAIVRTAFSTSVREAGDLSAGVFDLQGRMLAQAVTGTPGHVNAMAVSVGCFLERFPPEAMKPGDHYVTNDPWQGTGHLFDFTVVTPCFRADGARRPVALFASTAHVVDIGGVGFSPDAGEVFEEGLTVPIMRLFDGGRANDSLFEIVAANVREPMQVVGDLHALAASNDIGCRRLAEIMDEFGLDGLDEAAEHIVAASRRAMEEQIRRLPEGSWHQAMTVDGYDRPIELRARLTVAGGTIDIDFAGTSGLSAHGINVPLSYTQAYASFGVRSVVGGRVPNNAGSLAPIRVTAPPGCILNAPRPAAVAVRHVTGQMLPDVVLGCLAQAGVAVPAEGSSSLWNPSLMSVMGGESGNHAPGERFSVTVFHSGGTGARPGRAGLDATAFPSGVRSTPVEITEQIAPLIFTRKELLPGSGGEGRWRGGDGQAIEIAHAEGRAFAVLALFDRIHHPARGRAGGGPGAPGSIRLASGARLKGKGRQIVPAGDRLILELPAGGGLGRAEEREE